MSVPADDRWEQLVQIVERMAGGELDERIPISPAHDHLDAISHGVNVLVGELQYTTARQQRATEIADAANKAKSLFLRNVSHELRTPLSAMLGLTRLLLTPGVDEARRTELLGRVQSNGTVLLALLDELLDMSRLEANGLHLEVAPFSARALVGSVARDLDTSAQARGLRFTVVHEVNGPDAVLGDEKRVRQILTNLIGNAVKFTERGEVQVRVIVAPGADRVVVEVADTGIGMTDEQAQKLFEPFVQADASIAGRFGGSGLGLALSRRLARAMGGSLHIKATAPGQGTTFRLSLPLSTLPYPNAAEKGAESALQRLDGLRILLAEDHQDIRLAMHSLLQGQGAAVEEVEDGLMALARATRERFDVVLIDVRMPRMDGLEATRLLRTRGIQTPIIALTADAVREHQEECLAAGCSAYLTKPVAIDSLFATILRVAAR